MTVARKRELLEELLPLARANGLDDASLQAMQSPQWIDAVLVENLEHLLKLHRELGRLRVENAGLYERWQAARDARVDRDDA